MLRGDGFWLLELEGFAVRLRNCTLQQKNIIVVIAQNQASYMKKLPRALHAVKAMRHVSVSSSTVITLVISFGCRTTEVTAF